MNEKQYFVVAARNVNNRELYLNYNHVNPVTGLPDPYFSEKLNEATFFDLEEDYGPNVYNIISDSVMQKPMRSIIALMKVKELYSKMIFMNVGGLCSDDIVEVTI